MYRYDITKYKSRSNTNCMVTTPEWTAICDIGRWFNGSLLTIDDYKVVEDSYVNAILIILKYMKIDLVSVKDVYRWGDFLSRIEKQTYKSLYTKSIKDTYFSVSDNTKLDASMLSDLIRLQLREDIGASVYVPYRFKLFIGYDFLMGVHTSINLEDVFYDIEQLGLNICKF